MVLDWFDLSVTDLPCFFRKIMLWCPYGADFGFGLVRNNCDDICSQIFLKKVVIDGSVFGVIICPAGC